MQILMERYGECYYWEKEFLKANNFFPVLGIMFPLLTKKLLLVKI